MSYQKANNHSKLIKMMGRGGGQLIIVLTYSDNPSSNFLSVKCVFDKNKNRHKRCQGWHT